MATEIREVIVDSAKRFIYVGGVFKTDVPPKLSRGAQVSGYIKDGKAFVIDKTDDNKDIALKLEETAAVGEPEPPVEPPADEYMLQYKDGAVVRKWVPG